MADRPREPRRGPGDRPDRPARGRGTGPRRESSPDARADGPRPGPGRAGPRGPGASRGAQGPRPFRPGPRRGPDDRGFGGPPDRDRRDVRGPRPDRRPWDDRPSPPDRRPGEGRGPRPDRRPWDGPAPRPDRRPWDDRPTRPDRDGPHDRRPPFPGRDADRRPRPSVRRPGEAPWRPPFDAGRGGPPRAVPLPPPQELGPDEELVAGRRPVEEAFVARRPAVRLLVVPQRRAALQKLVLHATNLRIPIVEVEGGSLTALAGFDGHQGIALVVEPRRFASIDDVLARAVERGEPPFVLVLDSLEDPHNVGTLLRSAEAAGVHGVLFPTHRQAPLSPSAVKASAGAIEHLLLCPVDDLPGALSDLHARGLRIAGADGEAPLTARQTDLRGPLAIIVGSEGQGLGPAVRRRCDLFMRIPMKGSVGSLNAAVAGSVLLFEALAQRDPDATPRDTTPVTSTAREAGADPDAATDPEVASDSDTAASKSTDDTTPEPATPGASGTDNDTAPASDAPTAPAAPKARRRASRKTATTEPASADDDGSADPPPADPVPDDDLLPTDGSPARPRRTRKGT